MNTPIWSNRPITATCVALAAFISPSLELPAAEVPVIEGFVLATDRDAELAKLVPGTVDYFRLHLIHFENTAQWDKQEAMIADMRAQRKRGELRGIGENQLQTFELRRAVLRFTHQPDESGKVITRIMHLPFNHQQPVSAKEQNIPSSLAADLFDRERWVRAATASAGSSMNDVSDAQLPYILSYGVELNDGQVEQFLKRYNNAQSPGLVDLVVRHLKTKKSTGWSQFKIHHELTQAQMDDVLARVPKMRDDSRFTADYLTKLVPTGEVELWVDRDETIAYLERVWAYISTLPEGQNALRGQVLYRILEWDRKGGEVNRDRLMEYLKMQRPVAYLPRDFVRTSRHPMTFGDEFTKISGIAVINKAREESLVRDIVMDVLADDGNADAFSGLVNEPILQQWLAEAMIVSGKGERERWSRVLGPDRFTALRDRVDIEFAPTNPPRFKVDEPVKLDVVTKNAGKMEVKIYQINTLAFHEKNRSEIDGSLDLDGLVANHTRTIDTGDNPFVRQLATIDLPEIDGRGVWVVEMIGNGRGNRVVVRRGDMRIVTQSHPLGQEALILNELGQPFAGAEVRLGGHVFTADDDGRTVLPFSEEEKEQELVLFDPASSLARPASIGPLNEDYYFDISHVVPTESLVAGKKATIAVRVEAMINDLPLDPKRLVRPKLLLRMTDADGVSTLKSIPVDEVKFYQDLTIDFVVPERLNELSVVMSAEVKSVRTGEMERLDSFSSQDVNDGAATMSEGFVYWLPTEDGMVAELRGRNGELLKGHDVHVTVRDDNYRASQMNLLRSDEHGRVHLGDVPEWAVVEVNGSGRGKSMVGSSTMQRLNLEGTNEVHLGVDGVTIKAGESKSVPLTVTADDIDQRRVKLVELRNNRVVRDVSDQLKLTDGGLVIGSGLEPGAYALETADDRFSVEVIDGDWHGLWMLGERMAVRDAHQTLPRLSKAEVDGDVVTIDVADSSNRTRVYAIATRYQSDVLFEDGMAIFPMFFEQMVEATGAGPVSEFLDGRRISDEYRYILERRLAKRFPGNMLTRPELILNPWDVDKASAEDRKFKPGDDAFDDGGGGGFGRPSKKKSEKRAPAPRHDGYNLVSHPVYDFLADQPGFLIGVPLDENGHATINLKDLPAGRESLRLVVVDDGVVIDRSLVTGDAGEPSLRDRRTAPHSTGDQALALDDSVTAVPAGGTMTLTKSDGTRVAKIATIDDLAVYFGSVGAIAEFDEFGFVTHWQKLSDDEKRERYDKFACHGLRLFLAKYDEKFFADVVKPSLETKLEMSVVDNYLLGRDLTGYLAPETFHNLNALELALLARALPAGPDRDSVADALATRSSMLPPNPMERTEWILTALGASLETGGSSDGADDPFGGIVVTGGAANAPASRMRANRAGDYQFHPESEEVRYSIDSDSFADEAPAPMVMKESLGLKGADKLRQLYRALGLTKVYAESNYYQTRRSAQHAELIPVNPFWAALGAWTGEGTFLSAEIIREPVNVSEALAMLAFSGLPLEANDAGVESSDTESTLTAETPMIVVARQSVPAKKQDAQAGQVVWMDQQYFRVDDRFTMVDGQQVPKPLGGTVETGIAYGMTVSPMNMSGRDLVVDLHSMIPSGAIPLQNGQAMIGGSLFLGSYGTSASEVQFYFPAAGSYSAPASRVTSDGVLLASTTSRAFEVVEQINQVDKTSWAWIATHGSNDDVLGYLKNENLFATALGSIAWRMGDKAFFKQVTDLLRSRRAFNGPLWAYGVKHGDAVTTGEFLAVNPRSMGMLAPFIESDVVDFDPIERGVFEHLDFRPFVNARAHQLGGKAWVGNPKLHGQYTGMLEILARKSDFDDGDRLRVSYYLLLQDRIVDGLEWFDSINRDKVEAKMQYDYLACYAAFFRSDPDQAKTIASHYVGHTVDHWSEKFAAVVTQADEIAAGAAGTATGDSRAAEHERNAGAEPTLELRQSGPGSLSLNHTNADKVAVAFFEVDLELLFSRTPFLSADGDRFRIVRPTKEVELAMDGPTGESEIAIPDELKGRNLLVEVRAGGKSVHTMVSDHQLNVALAGNYGIVTVRNRTTGKPAPATYVKVYAKLKSGEVEFYKDGYTDLRGMFDYTSLNVDKLGGVEQFALLVSHDDLGTDIHEVAPPAR